MDFTNKEKYRDICLSFQDFPLFLQHWWLDAVCGKNGWDAMIYEKNGKVAGVFAYHFIRRSGFRLIVQPLLTQQTGIWFNYPDNQDDIKKFNFELEVTKAFVDELEKMNVDYYDQNFSSEFSNWLPFYWKGYQQTSRYTYRIADLTNLDAVFDRFSHAKRKQINKAMPNFSIDFEMSGSDFYKHLESTLKKKKDAEVLFNESQFLRLYNACIKHHQGMIVAAVDANKTVHAALFIVWDNNFAYNLISSIDIDFNSSGASTLVVWEAIKKMAEYTQVFDFEGSMDEGIENSFRQFGTVQTPYFRIYKHNSTVLKMLINLRKWK